MTEDAAQSTVVEAEPAQRVGGTRPVSRAERAVLRELADALGYHR